jgi:hypothetical protein
MFLVRPANTPRVYGLTPEEVSGFKGLNLRQKTLGFVITLFAISQEPDKRESKFKKLCTREVILFVLDMKHSAFFGDVPTPVPGGAWWHQLLQKNSFRPHQPILSLNACQLSQVSPFRSSNLILGVMDRVWASVHVLLFQGSLLLSPGSGTGIDHSLIYPSAH